MYILRHAIGCHSVIALVGFAGLAAAQSTEGQLIAVLSSTASVGEKDNACRLLKTVGTAKSVPALAALLSDKELSHPARLALETMPGEEAGAALRAALAKATGLERVGILASLGERRDADAVGLIAAALADPDPQVLANAAWSLGKIATPEAETVLRKTYSKARGDLRVASGNGLLLCAKNCLGKGQVGRAAVIYKDLAAADEPAAVRFGALIGQASLPGDGRAGIVRSFLESGESPTRRAGAAALPQLSADELRRVATSLANLSKESQLALLAAIRISGKPALRPAAVEGLSAPDADVCKAAVAAVGSVGDAADLPKLLPLMSRQDGVGEAALKAIESLTGTDTDDRILAAARNETDSRRLSEWINVILVRRPAGSAAVLCEEARHADPLVRSKAMAALAEIATPKDLSGLIAGVLATHARTERESAERAVVMVCKSIADPAARADAVIAAVSARAAGERTELLPLMGRFGTPRVAELVRQAMASSDAHEREAGLEALCNWPDVSAADQLWQLAKSAAEAPQRNMALMAYIRVVSMPGRGSDRRLADLKRAMATAETSGERKFVLQRANAIRTVATLRFLLPYLDQTGLAETACASIVELARHRELRDPNKTEFAAALDKVLKTSHDQPLLEQAKRFRDGR
jgi:HEAT repeat protein